MYPLFLKIIKLSHCPNPNAEMIYHAALVWTIFHNLDFWNTSLLLGYKKVLYRCTTGLFVLAAWSRWLTINETEAAHVVQCPSLCRQLNSDVLSIRCMAWPLSCVTLSLLTFKCCLLTSEPWTELHASLLRSGDSSGSLTDEFPPAVPDFAAPPLLKGRPHAK